MNRAGEIESALSSLEPVRVTPVAVHQEPDEGGADARADADEDEESANERSPIAPIGHSLWRSAFAATRFASSGGNTNKSDDSFKRVVYSYTLTVLSFFQIFHAHNQLYSTL